MLRVAPRRPSKAEYRQAAELRRTLRLFLQESQRAARANRLTPQRYQLLLEIKVLTDAGLPATVGTLSKALHQGQTSTTQLVRRAEDFGLVRRELSPKDARVRHVALTQEGERRLAATVAALGRERRRLASLLNEFTSGADGDGTGRAGARP
jgi:DNA-binding MarR family transcriptional regulator